MEPASGRHQTAASLWREPRTAAILGAYVLAVPVIYLATSPDVVPDAAAGAAGLAYLIAVAVGVARLVVRLRGSR